MGNISLDAELMNQKAMHLLTYCTPDFFQKKAIMKNIEKIIFSSCFSIQLELI